MEWRYEVLASGCAVLLAAMRVCRRRAVGADGALLDRVDHLVYATPDLAVGIDTAERLFGVRAS